MPSQNQLVLPLEFLTWWYKEVTQLFSVLHWHQFAHLAWSWVGIAPLGICVIVFFHMQMSSCSLHMSLPQLMWANALTLLNNNNNITKNQSRLNLSQLWNFLSLSCAFVGYDLLYIAFFSTVVLCVCVSFLLALWLWLKDI